MALCVTLGLCLVMIALIGVSERANVNTEIRAYEVVPTISKPPQETVVRETKLKVEALPKLPEPPPPTSTYSVVKLAKPEAAFKSAGGSLSKPSINTPVSLSLPAFNPTMGSGAAGTGAQRGSGGSGSGQGLGGSGSGTGGGLNQCTIEFTLAENDVVEDLIWQNCIGGEIANNAETAVRQWVKDKPATFRNLQSQVGDVLEFTFEQH